MLRHRPSQGATLWLISASALSLLCVAEVLCELDKNVTVDFGSLNKSGEHPQHICFTVWGCCYFLCFDRWMVRQTRSILQTGRPSNSTLWGSCWKVRNGCRIRCVGVYIYIKCSVLCVCVTLGWRCSMAAWMGTCISEWSQLCDSVSEQVIIECTVRWMCTCVFEGRIRSTGKEVCHWAHSGVLGGLGGVVNSLDFCPASLKSLGCFYCQWVLSS